MRLSKAVVCGGLILAGATQANAGSVDAKLLDMLKANGSISAAQHAELSADLARETREEKRAAKAVVKEKDFVAFRRHAGWAESTKLTGDMRVRQETSTSRTSPTSPVAATRIASASARASARSPR